MSKRKSFHVHNMDEFTIKAIKYIGMIDDQIVAEVIQSVIDEVINEYPELARARDQHRYQEEQEDAVQRLQRVSTPE